MTTLVQHRSFLSDILTRQHDRRRHIDPGHTFDPQPEITGYEPGHGIASGSGEDGTGEAGPSKRHITNYVSEEETVRNDLSGLYVQSGEFGSNHIFGANDKEICEE